MRNSCTMIKSRTVVPQCGVLSNGVFFYNFAIFFTTYFPGHRDVRYRIQLSNNGDLRTPLDATTHSQLFVRCRVIITWNIIIIIIIIITLITIIVSI